MSGEQIENISLQRRINLLEKENRLLKKRLQQAGIPYDDICGKDNNESSDLYDPDQGARIRPFVITDKTAEQFFEFFCRGRKDVYSLRYSNPKTGKTGYYPQCFNRWDSHCHIQKKDKIPCRECEIQSYKHIRGLQKQ